MRLEASALTLIIMCRSFAGETSVFAMLQVPISYCKGKIEASTIVDIEYIPGKRLCVGWWKELGRIREAVQIINRLSPLTVLLSIPLASTRNTQPWQGFIPH